MANISDQRVLADGRGSHLVREDQKQRDLLASADELAEHTGVAANTWITIGRLGVGPEPFVLGGRLVWRLAEVDAWRSDDQRRRRDERHAVWAVTEAFAAVSPS